MFFSNCGKEIGDTDTHCPSCGMKAGATPPTIPSDKLNVQILTLPSAVSAKLLAIIVGGVLMLIAMALNFYTLHYTQSRNHYSLDLDFNTLSDFKVPFGFDLNWAGACLPLICIMVFALVTILFAAYSLVTGQLYRRLYMLLGFLSAAALIANFLYVLVYLLNFDYESGARTYMSLEHNFYITPHVGCGLVIIGIIIIILGSRKLKADLKGKE